MRLLRLSDSGISLATYEPAKLPPYAILSHTWGNTDDEVSFHDVVNDTGKDKAGYAKILFCGEQALKDDLKDFWVDSCCIDKSNHAELSEAIVSMFRWYQKAEKCYVYLADVSASKHNRDGSECDWRDAFRKSRWFTRGWTLQELLAPKEVQFWSRDGHLLGTRESLKDLIHDITGIPTRALLGAQMSGFLTFEKMRWAAQRETKREEDKSYSLFGIFDVSMPIIYGEGRDKANRRLLTEIEKLQGASVGDATNGNPGNETRREELLASLAFDQMDSRHATIKEAQRTTCEWLLRHPDYFAWNKPERQSNGILWIAGKPGAGKSTLMKFALADARKSMTTEGIILDFFFNARGEDLEKTTLGMYRAFLVELLNQAPDLQEILDHNKDLNFRGSQQAFTWELGTLQALLREAVRKLGSRRLKLFIDALDECDEKQVREMVDYLEDLIEYDSPEGLSICFASRHYPTIEVRHGRRLVLEEQEGHAEDLSKYIKRRLKAGSGKKFDQVRDKVKEKANGVFMWVVFVVEILNDEFRRGRIFAVEKRLRDIPSELSELFKDILRRDRVDMDSLLLCLQWILFAKRPLSRQEFYFALEAGLHLSEGVQTPWQPQPWDPEEITDEDMNRFVLHSSKGLAELTKSKKAPTVQFIHESVRDFLLRDGGMQELWPNEFLGDLASESHDKLRKCCLAYLPVDTSDFHCLPKAHSDEAKLSRLKVISQFPFLQYARQGLLYHTEATQSELQETILQTFPLKKYVYCHNLLEPHENCRYSNEVSLVYVLAEQGHGQLVKKMYHESVWDRLPQERYQFPVLAAFAGGHRDALQALLGDDSVDVLDKLVNDPGYGKASQCNSTRDPLYWAALNKNWAFAEILLIARPTEVSSKTNPDVLDMAATHGTTTVVRLLLDAVRGVDVDAHGRLLGRALWVAASEGRGEMVQLLLDAGADVDALWGEPDSTALHEASHEGHREVVQLLLDAGADVNAQGGYSGNALQAACTKSNNEDVINMLLDAGADVNAKGGHFGNALQAASASGTEKVVQMLLDAGADVNAQGGEYGTALQAASRWGFEKVVRVLLDAGADVNAQWGEYGSALQAASWYGHWQVVRILLDAGADVNAQGGEYSSALHAASRFGWEKVVQVLLDAGADINAQGGHFGSALQAASYHGEEKVVRILLHAGADANAQGGEYGSALQAAVANRYYASEMEETVQMLLDAGAELQGECFDNAIEFALSKGRDEVVRMLRDAAARSR